MSQSPMPSSPARSRVWRMACCTTSPGRCAAPNFSPVSAARLGEFGRIRRFFAPLAGAGGLGLTDDAALIECAPGSTLVATVDAMVAGVHFLPDDSPDLVARKLLRVNLSDLAAMAARPR